MSVRQCRRLTKEENRRRRFRRFFVAAVAASITLGSASVVPTVAGASPISAKPTRPGSVTGLAFGAISKSQATYNVPVTWNPANNATGYQATLTSGSTVLDKATVSGTSWTGHTVVTAGTSVKVTIRAVARRRKGTPTSITTTLPDVTAPTGQFSVTWTDTVATVTQTSLNDDASAAAGIIRTVNWGEPGGLDEPWATGTTLNHTYPETEARYVPQVTLTDQAGNSVTLDLNAVVINDTLAPTGTLTTNTTAAWADYTPVHLTSSDVSDNWTPASLVTRTVTWGDGSEPELWTGTVPLSHVYATAGTYTPRVALVDEAGNDSLIEAAPVVVTADTAKPVVRLALPKSQRKAVRTWRVLKGTVRDQGTGAASVSVRVVEKRWGKWFAYKPATRRWVKAGSRGAAYSRAGVLRGTPGANGAWKVRVRNLKVGVLQYRVRGMDEVGNLSAVVSHKQRLTHR